MKDSIGCVRFLRKRVSLSPFNHKGRDPIRDTDSPSASTESYCVSNCVYRPYPCDWGKGLRDTETHRLTLETDNCFPSSGSLSLPSLIPLLPLREKGEEIKIKPDRWMQQLSWSLSRWETQDIKTQPKFNQYVGSARLYLTNQGRDKGSPHIDSVERAGLNRVLSLRYFF